MKKKLLIGIYIIIIILILIFYKNFKNTNNKISKTTEPLPTDISETFYSINLPNGYTSKHSNKIDYEDDLYMDKQKIGIIEINPENNYELSPSSIVENWIGMSAYIKKAVEEKNFGSYQRYKVLVGFEPSAAQEIKGESEPDQLHYFFVKNNLLLDLYIDLNYVNENNAEIIANSIELSN